MCERLRLGSRDEGYLRHRGTRPARPPTHPPPTRPPAALYNQREREQTAIYNESVAGKGGKKGGKKGDTKGKAGAKGKAESKGKAKK